MIEMWSIFYCGWLVVVLAFLTLISHQIIMAWCVGGWFSCSFFHGQTKYNSHEKRRKEFCRGLWLCSQFSHSRDFLISFLLHIIFFAFILFSFFCCLEISFSHTFVSYLPEERNNKKYWIWLSVGEKMSPLHCGSSMIY